MFVGLFALQSARELKHAFMGHKFSCARQCLNTMSHTNTNRH